MPQVPKKTSDSFILPKGTRERYIIPGTLADDPLKKYGILMAGLSELHPPYHIIKKNPTYHHIVYSMAGKAAYQNPNENGIFKSGCFWITPTKFDHSYWAKGDWNTMWFLVEDNEYWWFLHKWSGGQKHSIWKSHLLEVMEGYYAESMRQGKDSIGAAFHFGHLIYIFLSRDIKGEEDLRTKKTHNKLDRLWQEVNSKLQHRWTIDELARNINASASHLHRLVSMYNNTSPMGMVTILRMKRAKELLLHTNYPIKLISELTGYRTPYSFSKAFKRYAGVSPGSIRQKE